MSTVMAGRMLATVVAGLVIGLTGTAQAAQIGGTPGNDRIHGTQSRGCDRWVAGDDRIGAGKGPDTVTGGEGGDRVWGRWGADRLFGGPGDDRLWGGVGNDQSWGEDGNDVMGGGHGNDRQSGGAGNDLIYAARGQDESWGEDGDDTLWALARRTCTGRNDMQGDVLHGGPGNDTFRDARRRAGHGRLRAGDRHGLRSTSRTCSRTRPSARSSTGRDAPRRAKIAGERGTDGHVSPRE